MNKIERHFFAKKKGSKKIAIFAIIPDPLNLQSIIF